MHEYNQPNTRVLPTAGRAVWVDTGPPGRRRPRRPGRNENTSGPQGDNQERAGRRAKQVSRDYTLHNRLYLMITLTIPNPGVHEYDEAYRLLRTWFAHGDGRKLLPEAYLAVPELHPGGHGYHWHALYPRRLEPLELAALRASWTAHLAAAGYPPSGGAVYARIDLSDFRYATSKKGKRYRIAGREGVRRAAQYAGKYIRKSLADQTVPPGRHRYLRALHHDPTSERLRLADAGDLCNVLRDNYGAESIYVVDSNDLADWHHFFRFVLALWLPAMEGLD